MTARERLNHRPALFPPTPTSCASTNRKSAFELRYQPPRHASEDAEQACVPRRSRSPCRRKRHSPPMRRLDKPSDPH